MKVAIKQIGTQLASDGRISLVVEADFGQEPVTVIVPEEALANRMLVYGLATGDDALTAILKEHAQRLGNLQPEGVDRVARLGGRRSDVSVVRQRVRVSEEAREIINHAH